MKNDYIDIATSNPKLRGKIRQNVTGPTDTIYWYIKFNIPLDPRTVNEDNMNVMDVGGDVLATVISYDSANNLIVIHPLVSYQQNASYILNVFNDVCSSNGNRLKEDVQVVFKLKGTEIVDYKILKGKEIVNKQAFSLYKNDKTKLQKSRSSSLEKHIAANTLPTVSFKINFIIGIIGIVAFFASLLAQFLIGIIVSTVLLIVGVSHIVMQLTNNRTKSTRAYNQGATLYNAGHIQSALYCFENALMLDVDNDVARQAINKATKQL